MPLALLAIGSELDPTIYEVVIIDGRLDPDPETKSARPHLSGAVCLGVTVLTGAPISDALADVARREAAHAPNSRSSGAAGIRRCSPASAWPSRPSTSPCRDRAKRRSPRSSRRIADGRSLEGCAGCTVRLADGRSARESAAPALTRRHVPGARLRSDTGRALLRAQGQASARLHLLAGLQLSLCILFGPVRLRAQVGRASIRGSMVTAAAEFMARLPLRRRQFPGRDVLHAARPRPVDGRADHRVRDRSSPGRRPCAPTRACACPMTSGRGARQSGLRTAAGRRRIGLGRDAETHPQGHHARAGVSHRRKMREHGIAGNFPFIVGFPGRERRQRSRDARDVAKRLARDEPGVRDADLLLQAVPGQRDRHRSRRSAGSASRLRSRRGRSSISSTALPGPWVSPRARSSSSSASSSSSTSRWKKRSSGRTLAATRWRRYRCSRDDYRWPLEMHLLRWLGSPSRSCRDRAAPHPAHQSDDHVASQRAVSAGRAEPGHVARGAGYAARIIDGNVDRRVHRDGGTARCCERALRCGRGDRDGRAAGADSASRSRRPSARGFRRCRSSGAATSRRSVPDAPRITRLRRLRRPRPGRGHAVCESARLLLVAGHARRAGAIAGLTWRASGRHRAQHESRSARFCRALADAAVRADSRIRAVPEQDLPGPAHCRLPGGARLSLPLHVLRCGNDVPRQDSVAAAARLEQDLGISARPASAWTRSSSTTTTSSTAKSTWCRCSKCWRGSNCRGGVMRASDALLNLSERSWALVRKSRLRMAYIGAESPSDWLLHDVRKGTRSDQTTGGGGDVPRNGVIPGTVVHGRASQDPEGETEKTFEFIRKVKRSSSGHRNHDLRLHAAAAAHAETGARIATRSSTPLRDVEGKAGRVSRRRLTDGPNPPGLTTGVTRMRRGSPLDCGSASSISRPCSAADSRPSRTSARLHGEKRRCARLPPGATSIGATIVPGS